MKYYKNVVNGGVYAFEDDANEDEYMTDELVRMTEEEVYAHLHPVPVFSAEEIERMRLLSYSDPLTGSDRYYTESIRERIAGNVEAAEAAEGNGLRRYEEIRAGLPWPTQSA